MKNPLLGREKHHASEFHLPKTNHLPINVAAGLHASSTIASCPALLRAYRNQTRRTYERNDCCLLQEVNHL